MAERTLLNVNNLKTQFLRHKHKLTAVDKVSFKVKEGEILGIVGESGCGKSVTSKSILRLFDEKRETKISGDVMFKGENILKFSKKKLQSLRGNDIAMIFQDPLSSLTPVYTIGYQIIESIKIHQNLSNKEAYKKALEMLEKTGIPAPKDRLKEYPHQLSGGMRQRVMIAIALSCVPKLLIADEPTTALDVTIQAQILELIIQLKEELNMGVIFITHDLGVVAEVCDRVAVMYLGQIVEEANIQDLFSDPLHPYTQGLIKSIPQLDGDRTQKLSTIEGSVPSLDNKPHGCKFSNRCPFAQKKCYEKDPIFEHFDNKRKVKCWFAKEIREKRGELIGCK